ncbi:phage tail sheath subtilisin-like domain-containing protein [Vibrio furnissii]|uniref:phage tail sheath subtilisin-like domain-containing protein n=1 Tax=Vibrio furnissii TaxID=29494 RepID=UPI0015588177|nr:phage tail sheath subtilisin-like domain-containing protein [Vibrio furnissii]
MSISFNEIPASARVPGVYVEIDNSLANNAEELQKVLVIGRAAEIEPPEASPTTRAEGSEIIGANVVALCMNEDRAKALFGESEIVGMVEFYRKQDETLPVYAIGVADGDLMSALAALGDVQYHHIICSLNDTTSVRDLGEFLETRYNAMNQIPGLAYVPYKGKHAELITFAEKSNCPLISFMPVNAIGNSADAPVSEAQAVAGWAGQIAPSLASDPCRPLQTLTINGLYSLAEMEWDWAERNLLLYSGMSTYIASSTQQVQIERVVTAYTKNASGIADDSYLDIMTPATAMYFRQKQRSLILSKYARHKLVKDGTNFAPGQVIVTPSMIKTELLALYKSLEWQGVVQDFDGYKDSLIVELDENNKQRVNYQDSPQFVNGLMITAGKIQLRK